MAINVVPLDDSHDIDPFTILVGKDVVVAFKPSSPLTDRNKIMASLIATPDLLTNDTTLNKLRDMQLWTDEIAKTVGNMINLRDREDVDKKLLRRFFEGARGDIKQLASQIAKAEDELQIYLAEEHRICFCEKCDAFLGFAEEPLPAACKVCKKKTERNIEKAEALRYLGKEPRNYLQGIWFQDYVAKVLKTMGWDTWTECLVMGASGVYHPIDILAVKPNEGRVAIIECKRTPEGDHAFKLAARFTDIQPSFGLLVTFNKLNSTQGKNLLAKKPGLKLVELAGHTDQMIEKALADYISREN